MMARHELICRLAKIFTDDPVTAIHLHARVGEAVQVVIERFATNEELEKVAALLEEQKRANVIVRIEH